MDCRVIAQLDSFVDSFVSQLHAYVEGFWGIIVPGHHVGKLILKTCTFWMVPFQTSC